MAVERTVYWSVEAGDQVNAIREFILEQWSEKEVEVFLDLLHEFEQLVKQFPKGYQASTRYPGCRRAIVHPHVSVVYKLSGEVIEVVTVYDNRSAKSQGETDR